MRLAEIVLIAVAVFLLLDSLLSIILGNRYMLWGLEYTPKAYGNFIERISALPPGILRRIKFTEMALGVLLLWLGLRSIL
ncbi:MAG: hypothetical protein OIN66_08435 [Candidatus Methanoperedens sp.]|nr:hypothetical protein [Candidatus Methanoperedens sp.]